MADRSVRVRFEAITQQYDRRISESAVLTNRFASELEAADGRMANMVQSALALAPALVPIGAAGIPAVAGLAAQLGFAVLGTGALVLGLHNVGDALKAFDAAQLHPTEQNLEKLRAEMQKLGPAGGDFVLFLDHLEPRLHRLQALAEQGLLPGVEDGIRSLLTLMPQVREMVFNLSSTGGDVIRQAGSDLTDPRWRQFFDFLQTHARPTLTDMGQTAENFALSFANLVRTFDPLEQDFTRGLLHMSQEVEQWSAGLERDQGFQDLVDYARENGPRALDTLGAFADALVQIVEAAAPVGSVALPVLTELLKVVGGIADTPVVGSSLVGLAAAIGIYGRSLALLKTVGLRGNGEGVLAATFGGAKTSIRDAATALTQVTTAQDRARLSASELAAVEERRAATVRNGLTTLGKGAALAVGFAVAQTGVADSVGLSNTATLALMGTIGGPFGAAVGGATGLVLDLAHANDDLEHALKQVDSAAARLDFGTMRAGIADLEKQLKDAQGSTGPGDSLSDAIRDWAFGIGHPGAFAGSRRENDISRAVESRTKQLEALRKNTADLFASLNHGDPSLQGASDDQLTAFITKISPALQRANVDVVQLLQHRTGWTQAQVAVKEWVNEMDSAKGRSQAVGEALANLQSEITPTVDAAKALADALDALFGPQMSQAEALDQWIGGLRDLRKELKETGGGLSIDGVTGKALDQALKNREQIRGSVNDLLDKAKADAAAGVAPDRIARELTKGRDAIIQIAVAAGQSRPEVEKYLRRLGLTASNLNTILDTTVTKLHGISAQLAALVGKSYNVKVRAIYDATHNNAVGSFNAGDVANRHMPELAGPGVTRVWREPETMGEAYIPLANDFRRPRAISIWERTGQALGVQFRRYAFGGMTATTGGSVVPIDYDRLAAALSSIRPLYGPVHMQPHNYSEFQRQMQADAAAAAIGGIPKDRR